MIYTFIINKKAYTSKHTDLDEAVQDLVYQLMFDTYPANVASYLGEQAKLFLKYFPGRETVKLSFNFGNLESKIDKMITTSKR